MDPALGELLRTQPATREVELILRLTHPAVRIPGVRIVAQFGTIVTCRLPIERILETRGQDDVASVKAPRLLAPEAPVTLSDSAVRARTTDIRRPPGSRYTGRGCVIGFLDWGFALGAPSLRHADGRTRLLAFWDQRRAGRGRANRYGYGTIYDAACINDALATRDPYATLGYHPGESDPSRIGAHGTHTVDIAAGNGRGGGPLGIAPEADIVCVHLGTEAPGASPLENFGDSVRALEAIDFIRRVAGRRPFVVSASIGRHGGPHDGTTLLEQSADSLIAVNPNALCVHSAGNYHSRQCHASGKLKPGETRTLRLIVDPRDRTPNEVEIWYDRGSRFSVCVNAPHGNRSPWVALGQRADLESDGRVICRIYHRERDPQNGANLIDLFITADPGAGEWGLTLRADDATTTGSTFHAWVERDDSCGECQARFHPDDADRSVTTSTLANGRRSIAVGAFDAHDAARPIASFSSAGPTRDGRVKPDCVAAGVGILAARSPWFGEPDGSALTRRSGTSMAAPHVSGCAALVLEASRGTLGSGELREIILTTLEGAGTGSDRNRYGLGYLDVMRAVTAAERVARRRETPPGRSFVHHEAAEENQAMSTDQEFRARLLDAANHLIGRAQGASGDDLLRVAVRGGGDRDASIGAQTVYRDFCRENSSRPTLGATEVMVVARPLERIVGQVVPGDLIVRRALGEAGLIHVALAAGREVRHSELAGMGLTPEDDAGEPGWYVQVVEGGTHPHGIRDRFARRTRDATGRCGLGQIILRLTPPGKSTRQRDDRDRLHDLVTEFRRDRISAEDPRAGPRQSSLAISWAEADETPISTLHDLAVYGMNLTRRERVALMKNIAPRFGIPDDGFARRQAHLYEGADIRLRGLLRRLRNARTAAAVEANLQRAKDHFPNESLALVLVTANREHHRSISARGSELINTWHQGGLDFLWQNRHRLGLPTSITQHWREATPFVSPETGNIVHPGLIPARDELLAYAAQTASSFAGFEAFLKRTVGDAEGTRVLADLTDDARLVWRAFSFLTPGGNEFNARVGPQHGKHFGVRSAFGFLRSKADTAGRPLDLNEILTEFELHKTHAVSSAKVRAAEARFLEVLQARVDDLKTNNVQQHVDRAQSEHRVGTHVIPPPMDAGDQLVTDDVRDASPFLEEATAASWEALETLRRSAASSRSPSAVSAARIRAETGIRVDPSPYFGLTRQKLEAVIRCAYTSTQMPDVLLALWATEGSTRMVTEPRLVTQATTAQNAKTIFRCQVYYQDLGADHFLVTTRAANEDNQWDDGDSAAAGHETHFNAQVRRLIASGHLSEDISEAINAELVVSATAPYTVQPTVAFYALSLRLADALFSQLQANSFPELPVVTTALNYMQWNMGTGSFRRFLASADRHRRESTFAVGGAPMELERWALHTPPKANEFRQSRVNALRFTHYVSSYGPLFQPHLPLIKPGVEDLTLPSNLG